MVVKAETLNRRFSQRAEDLAAAVRSGLRANRGRSLNRAAVDGIYEAAFLSLAKSFEVFVEEIFFLVLVEGPERHGIADAAPRIRFATRDAAEDYVLDRKDYLDWMPWKSRALDRANRYLVNGEPFSRLSRVPAQLEVLRVHGIIRNAVAHDSGLARRKFLGLNEVKTLPVSEQRPASLLRSTDAATQASYWELHREELLGIAKALSAADRASARQYLGNEDPYRRGERPADAGPFRCRRCRHQRRCRTGYALPECPQCGEKVLWDRV